MCMWPRLGRLCATHSGPTCRRFWNHKHWKVRHGVLQTVAEAMTDGVDLVGTKDQANHIITNVANLVEDPNEWV